MKRRDAIIAKNEERKTRTLTEVDFLIGFYDETRMGGLRFLYIEILITTQWLCVEINILFDICDVEIIIFSG